MKNLGKKERREDEIGLPPDLQKNPFYVPENYFQQLEKDILLHTSIPEFSDSAYPTPSNYQQQLTNDILARVSEEKIKAAVPDDGFSIPEDYFTTLQREILKRTVPEPMVIPIKRKKTSWISYAAAASIALAVSTFAWFSQTQYSENNISNQQVKLETLPTEEIIDYLAFYTEPGDLTRLSDQLPAKEEDFADSFSSEEIESYLENSI